MKSRLRTVWTAMMLGVAGTGSSQIEPGWIDIFQGRIYEAFNHVVPAGNGVLYASGGQNVYAFGRPGTLMWKSAMPFLLSDVRATTEGRTYGCGYIPWMYGDPNVARILCLGPNGDLLWTYQPDWAGQDTVNQFRSMRVSGNDLWVVGMRRMNVDGVDRDGIAYEKLNRLTGAFVHGTYFVIGSDPAISECGVKIVGTATANFILVQGWGASDFKGVARMNLTTGALVSSTFLPGKPTSMVVDSNNQVYVADGSIHKYDGNQQPNMPELWSRGTFQTFVMLSKGYLYSADIGYVSGTPGGTALMRTSPSGEHVPFVDAYKPIQSFVADAQGRIYIASKINDYAWLMAVSSQGGVLGNLLYNDEYDQGLTGMSVDSRGTVNMSTFRSRSRKLFTFFQKPEPVPDAYVAPSGRPLSIAAPTPTVMHNDLYTDEAVCKTVLAANASHGTVVMATNGRFTYTANPGFDGEDSFQYTVYRGGLSANGTVVMTVKRSANLSLAKNQISGQNAMLGTITLSSVVATPTVVSVTDNSSLVTTPGSVTVPAGQTTKTFGIQVLPVISNITTQITASYNGLSQSETLTLLPLIPTALVLTPSTVVGGNAVSARVIMNGVAGVSGRTFAVRSTSSSAQPPLTIIVPPGQSSYTFSIPTNSVTASVLTTIKVSATAGFKTAYLRINP